MIIHNCEQGTDEWHSLRAGIPTSSEFSKLVTSQAKESKSIDDYSIVLAAEKYAGKMVDVFAGNKYTERGHLLEAEACADYEMENQVSIDHVGFITNKLMTYGGSPDGLINEDGSIEVKCKIAKEHIEVLLKYKETGEIPTEYFAQPQGIMMIAKRKWCDLVFYHPDLPCLTVRQYPDAEFLKVLEKQLKSVIVKRNIILEKLNDL